VEPLSVGPFLPADYEALPRRAPVYLPPGSGNGYQVESWIDRQLSKGAVLRDRDGNPIRVRDGMLLRPMAGGSFITGTGQELIYSNIAAGTAKNTFTTEIGINDTAGMGAVAHVPVDFWTPSNVIGKVLRVEAYGIVSSTATPTFTFTTRVGTQLNVTAAIILGTAALTAGSGITNLGWSCHGNVTLTVVGAAGANSTGRGVGQHVAGNTVFTTNSGVNPYNAAASTTAPTVATIDTSIVNYINFNVACSASSASNGVTLLGLQVWGLN
jgi:hypothetical protein